MKTALIILDVQNCFITEKTKRLPLKIKKHIQTNEYSFIIFSKFINTDKSNFVKKLNWNKCKEPHETQITPELSKIASENHIFEKNTYSILKSKQFIQFLKQKKITKLYFCGLDLDACVLASAFEAFDFGYDYEILTDLTETSAKIVTKTATIKIIKRNLK